MATKKRYVISALHTSPWIISTLMVIEKYSDTTMIMVAL